MPSHLWPQKRIRYFNWTHACTLKLDHPRLATAAALAPPAPPQGKVKTLYIKSTGAEQVRLINKQSNQLGEPKLSLVHEMNGIKYSTG